MRHKAPEPLEKQIATLAKPAGGVLEFSLIQVVCMLSCCCTDNSRIAFEAGAAARHSCSWLCLMSAALQDLDPDKSELKKAYVV
eukprot:751677-Amphidinium_carterae.1